MNELDQIKSLLSRCSQDQRGEVFRLLREEFNVHPLEAQLNTQAEIILEAIQRAGGLTLRMMRGVIAEAAFEIEVVEQLQNWSNKTPPGDLAYDFLLDDSQGAIRVQVKLQRSKEHRPMWANEAYRSLPGDLFVVETQRTRKGSNTSGGSTRPYRFDEFDLLAVAMHPSTNRWDRFMYTVAGWLLPNPADAGELLKYQPVSANANEDWTDDFATAARWLRDGHQKRIRG